MTKKEYCNRLVELLAAGLKADREGRRADKYYIFCEHDDMVENPQNYITED